MATDQDKCRALRVTPLTANDYTELVLSTGGGHGPFDESHDGGVLFWRGDGRDPADVYRTGFKAAHILTNHATKKKKIIWRASDDDIEHDSAVALARDIRGAAFFPFSDANHEERTRDFHIYAIAPEWTANTYRAQQIAEAVETGKMEGAFPPRKKGFWRELEERWAYDPEEIDSDNASCVWQFQEHATLVIPVEHIVGCWEATRTMMVEPGVDDREKAGIRFALGRKVRSSKKHDLHDEASQIVAGYQQSYPKKYGDWLSFQGIVRCGKKVDDQSDAKLLATQIQAIVVQEGKPSDRGGA